MITWSNRLSLMIILLTGGISTAYAQGVKPLISVEKTDSQFSNIISKTINAHIIAEGFAWCEGPLWIESHKMLLFSDVKKNIIYKWTREKGKEVYLTPSGYTGKTPRGGELG